MTMHVVVGPVLVEDRICRIIAAVSSLLEVEEWAGGWWAPSSVTLSVVAGSLPVAESMLRDRGVPAEDWVAIYPRTAHPDIEALLRTHDSGSAMDTRLDHEVARARAPRTRSYPGNVRFRKSVQAMTSGTDVVADAPDIVQRTRPAGSNSGSTRRSR